MWAKCLFADPVADIAVLGQPDNQDLHEEAQKYDELAWSVEPLAISDIKACDPSERDWAKDRVWVLSLDGEWNECMAGHIGGRSLLTKGPIVSGMSGSPVVDDLGAAIAAISSGSEREHLNPRLTQSLPGWLLSAQKKRQATRRIILARK